MKSFPQPLTAAEEKYYMQKYTEGDLEAKHILIERNLRLVAHIVKKYQPPPEEMEDLLSIGTIGERGFVYPRFGWYRSSLCFSRGRDCCFCKKRYPFK